MSIVTFLFGHKHSIRWQVASCLFISLLKQNASSSSAYLLIPPNDLLELHVHSRVASTYPLNLNCRKCGNVQGCGIYILGLGVLVGLQCSLHGNLLPHFISMVTVTMTLGIFIPDSFSMASTSTLTFRKFNTPKADEEEKS